MNDDELKNIVIRNADQIAQIRSQLTQSGSRERRAVEALDRLRHRVQDALGGFDRDGYKATDQRLLVYALAAEILIFDKLGYDIGEIGCEFLLGVYALLPTVRVYSKTPSSVGISSLCAFKLSKYNSIASFAISVASSIDLP